MRYSHIYLYDVANGPGIRVVLWTQGCEHHCKECHNPETWNPKKGREFGSAEETVMLDFLSQDFCAGLSISGGDPFHPINRDGVRALTKSAKRIAPDKKTWVWTGYLFEDLPTDLLKYVDVLVDGKYEKDKKDVSLPYCGSSNQRVIDVQKSIKEHKVILWQSSTEPDISSQ